VTEPVLSYRRRVAWRDTDASGAWHFTAALHYVEEAETQFLREAGIPHQTTMALPRIYVEAQFRCPVGFDDEIEVRLSLARLGTSSIHYEFTIVKDDEIAAEGRLGVAFVGGSATSQSLPREVRSALEARASLGRSGAFGEHR
jgi:acyl-CoA thioester hydrolase